MPDEMTEIVMAQTPPILHGPSEKERKYDRQLRLWAASGQAALESANLLLVNSGSGVVGVETLKNLVLPGIGRFTIYDEKLVDEADLGVNFFLDQGSLGKPRSRCLTEMLLELNPEVEGDWYPKQEVQWSRQTPELDGSRAYTPMLQDTSLESLLESSPVFTSVLYTHPVRSEYIPLFEAYSRLHKTPLVAIHSAGFYSSFQLTLPGAFAIVDTHPDETATTDLRVLSPWPELVEFARAMTRDIDKLDDHEHGHLPYLVLLLHFLDQWRDSHGNQYPSTYKEKTEFRNLVQSGARTDNAEGGEENFDEAAAAVLKALVPPSLPSGLREVFEYEPKDLAEKSSGFWIIASAIKNYYAENGSLPLPGSLPDMKAKSGVYIQLQNIYKKKAREDVTDILRRVQATPGGEHVDSAEVELFCKNAAHVKLINATNGDAGANFTKVDRLKRVVDQELANDEFAEESLMPLSLVPIYLVLQATAHVVSASAQEIVAEVAKIVPHAEQNERIVKAAQEVARAEGGELHNIAALTGGMVAQEMIKIITKQYIPIDNTCIFDGISSRCQVLRL
ncbi:putative NEDD8-activating enzyme E1 regulatory subunit [Rhypophila decipiens]|uniref:NEDD8-activating enzyme E1 regulatory subunit n=1 Tax=Rhypophila decipiens TaxID=261697 RepID=A0AAN6YAW9_9PEZI|nr:putative NEDD8-activating enzyme E1 regulatory subunit [Rhypophila decipiens]